MIIVFNTWNILIILEIVNYRETEKVTIFNLFGTTESGFECLEIRSISG